jgi:hypothetical protein
MTEIPARLSVVTGSGNPIGWSGVAFACTVDTRDGVDKAFAAAVFAGAAPVADATDRWWGGRSALSAHLGGPGPRSMRAAPCSPGVERGPAT